MSIGRQPKRFYKKRRAPTQPDIPKPWLGSALMPYVAAFNEWSLMHGFTPKGVELRNKALVRFVAWAHERSMAQLADVTRPVLEQYQRHLFHYRQASGKPLSFTSQQLLLVPLRGFFKWAARERHLLYNPAGELMLPRKGLRLPRYVMSIDEVERVMREVEVTHPGGVRDRAILETLYSTGLRRSELAALALYDWRRDTGTLRVRAGKGDRERVVPLGDRAAAWLAKYVDEVRPMLAINDNDATLFLTDYGESFEKNRLGDMVRRYLDWAEIAAPGSCHLLRHACATHMLENGADVRYIQVLLGHADINSTEVYTHVSISQLKRVHAATHPARLNRASVLAPTSAHEHVQTPDADTASD